MEGYILLADGMRLGGQIIGPAKVAPGRLIANTAVVGFQEMVTDPAYRGAILAFTYPEVGSVGVARRFAESEGVQVAGLAVKVLSEFRSHYLAERDFAEMLAADGVPCLTGVDTRALAVHLREAGEMSAAIAPADADSKEVQEALKQAAEPPSRPCGKNPDSPAQGKPLLAVLDLGARRSDLRQLAARCALRVHAQDASAKEILADRPAGLYVSDGPGYCEPPAAAVKALKDIVGRLPILACGLGQVALGMALGCRPTLLKRGHHGANHPVRDLATGAVQVTQQRHTLMLDRSSVDRCADAQVLCENLHDKTVEGIRSADGSVTGYQYILAAPEPDALNASILAFQSRLAVR